MIDSFFIFVRHGQSQANADAFIADANSLLTEKGIQQAKNTADEIRKFNIKYIICSPYIRAQQTAETIAGELGIEISHIKIHDDLKERDLGVLEGKPREYEGIWYFLNNNVENIEKSEDLFCRMQKCFDFLKKESVRGNLLVVGHAISGFYLTQVSLGKKSVEEFDSPSQMSNADFIKIEIKG